MKVIKFFLVLLLTFFIVGMAGMAYLVDYLDDHKGLLERMASDASGRQVRIEKGVALNLSLMPSIAIEGLLVGNPEWLDKDSFIRAERAELELDILALLSRRLVVSEVKLENADILLQISKDGKRNWILDTRSTSNFTWAVDEFNAEELRVQYRSGSQPVDVKITAIEVLGVGTDELSVDADFTYKGQPVAIEMKPVLPAESGKAMEFTDLKLKTAGRNFTGSLNIPFDIKGRASLKLAMQELDLTPLFETKMARGEDPYGLLKKQWPLDSLPNQNIDFQLDIGTIHIDDLAFRKVSLDGSLINKNLQLKISDEADNLAIKINLKPQGKQWQLQFVNKSKLGLGLLIDSRGAKDSRSQAPVTVNIGLTGMGQSLSDMLASAEGHADIIVGEGYLSEEVSEYLPMGSVLFSVLENSGPDKQKKQAQLECAVLHMDVSNGIGTSKETLALQTDVVNVLGGGAIKLGNGEIDLQFRTLQRKGVGLSLKDMGSKHIHLRGTLEQPRVDVNLGSVTASTGAAWITGGLSLLVEGLASHLTGDRNPCDTVSNSLASRKADTKPGK